MRGIWTGEGQLTGRIWSDTVIRHVYVECESVYWLTQYLLPLRCRLGACILCKLDKAPPHPSLCNSVAPSIYYASSCSCRIHKSRLASRYIRFSSFLITLVATGWPAGRRRQTVWSVDRGYIMQSAAVVHGRWKWLDFRCRPQQVGGCWKSPEMKTAASVAATKAAY